MAVFEELNRRANRMQDPEARKAGKIERALPGAGKRKSGSSSVSVGTYKRTGILVNIGTIIVIAAVVITFGYFAITTFIK